MEEAKTEIPQIALQIKVIISIWLHEKPRELKIELPELEVSGEEVATLIAAHRKQER